MVSGSSHGYGLPSKITLPFVKQVYPSLIASRLVGIQPYGVMTEALADPEFVATIADWLVETFPQLGQTMSLSMSGVYPNFSTILLKMGEETLVGITVYAKSINIGRDQTDVEKFDYADSGSIERLQESIERRLTEFLSRS